MPAACLVKILSQSERLSLAVLATSKGMPFGQAICLPDEDLALIPDLPDAQHHPRSAHGQSRARTNVSPDRLVEVPAVDHLRYAGRPAPQRMPTT